MPYVGFLRRLVAYILDSLFLLALFSLIDVATNGAMYREMIVPVGKEYVNLGFFPSPIGNVVSILMAWLYFAVLESSALQATLGKMVLGCKVVDERGDQIGFGRATGRHFAKILSAMTLLIGYLMIIFTSRKQGLHDMVAGTFVVRRSAEPVVDTGYGYQPMQASSGGHPLRDGRFRN